NKSIAKLSTTTGKL
ncbi:bacterial NAD-glutamate dehydrogenase family protein, partial [Vibrio parahaemolyticus V-223/04]